MGLLGQLSLLPLLTELEESKEASPLLVFLCSSQRRSCSSYLRERRPIACTFPPGAVLALFSDGEWITAYAEVTEFLPVSHELTRSSTANAMTA